MLENRWAREYLAQIFDDNQSGLEHLRELVAETGIEEFETPLLEIAFLRQGGSPVECLQLALAALALCSEETPLDVVATLVETVEDCNGRLNALQDELPALQQAVRDEPENGERLAKLGFALSASGHREAALSTFTKALEYPDTICIQCHRDSLVQIGWDHYLRSEYEQALGWFEIACNLREAPPDDQISDHFVSAQGEDANDDIPYQLALEDVLLTLAKMGRLGEAATRIEEYHDHFGRLPTYESYALKQLGLDTDLIYIRSRTADA